MLLLFYGLSSYQNDKYGQKKDRLFDIEGCTEKVEEIKKDIEKQCQF